MKQGHEVSVPTQQKIGLLAEVIEKEEQPPFQAVVQEQSEDEEDYDQENGTDLVEPTVTVPRDGLIKIPVNVAGTMMTGVFDSGSQLNIVNQRLIEAAGIPWSNAEEHRIPMMSVDGNLSQCAGMIPCAEMTMKTTKGKVMAPGNLYVKKNAGFQLLLGREWGVDHKATWIEDGRNSHLRIITNKGWRKIRPLPSTYGSRDNEEDNKNFRYQPQDYQARVYAIGGNKEIEEGEIPDSEEEEGSLVIGSNMAGVETEALEERENDFIYSPVTITREDPPTPAQRREALVLDEDDRRSETDDEIGRIGTEDDLRKPEETRAERGTEVYSDEDINGRSNENSISSVVLIRCRCTLPPYLVFVQ
jgi:hypothetical protein